MKKVNKNETSDIFKIKKKNKEKKYFFSRYGSRGTSELCEAAIICESFQSILGVIIQVRSVSLFRLDLCHYSG